jgi:hypothetical protein
VVYEKALQQNAPAQLTRNALPRGVSQPAGGGAFGIKAVFVVVLLGCASYFGYSFAKGTSILPVIGFSSQGNQQTITNLKAELQAYEDGLQRIEAQIAHDRASVGTCSITGQPNQYILDQDPRPELQAKIEQLKQEIRKLEGKS